MSDPLTYLKDATEKIVMNTGYVPYVPELPEWIEVQPVQVAINRLTGERIFLDPTDGMWRYLPSRGTTLTKKQEICDGSSAR